MLVSSLILEQIRQVAAQQAIPLQCVPDRLVVGSGDIAEGLHELAAVHHKGLVELIEHL
jgi:hypothetical protein